MEASERLEWLSAITASDVTVPPCAYEVAIQLAKHANRDTGLAYPGLGSRVGKNSARRGAKWLRDHGWIVPVDQASGRQATYRLVSPLNRVQGCTGFNPDAPPASGLTPPRHQPCSPPGISPDALTGSNRGMNQEGTGSAPEPGLFDGPLKPPATQPSASHLAACDAKFAHGDLLAGIKRFMGKTTRGNANLHEWQALVDEHGWQAVSEAAMQVGPAERWPDRVAQVIWDKENTCPHPPGSDQAINWLMLHGKLGNLA